MNTYHIKHLDAHLCYHDLPGDTPALVFIHGLGSASSSAFPQVAARPCLRDRRAILIDLLGYGFSDRPSAFDYTMESQTRIIVELLAELHLSDAIVVGHSMGGAIAVLVAAAAPDIVTSLVSAEGNLDPVPGSVSGVVTSMPETQFAEHGHSQFVEQMQAAGLADYASTVRACDPIAMHRSSVSLIAQRSPTYREQLAALPIPRMFLFGDRNVPHLDIERLATDGVDVRIIANAGHDMAGDNPDGLAQAIAAAARTTH